MDWGLARRVDGGLDDSLAGLVSVDLPPGPQLPEEDLPSNITQHGDVLGTPAYMPPEQARGQRELHGPASDVYALGAILYHVLSGRRALPRHQRGRAAPGEGRAAAAALEAALHGRAAVPEELVVHLRARHAPRDIRALPERRAPRAARSSPSWRARGGASRRWACVEQARARWSRASRSCGRWRPRVAPRRRPSWARWQPFDPIEKKRARLGPRGRGRRARPRGRAARDGVAPDGARRAHPLPGAARGPRAARRSLPRLRHRRRAGPPRRGRGRASRPCSAPTIAGSTRPSSGARARCR